MKMPPSSPSVALALLALGLLGTLWACWLPGAPATLFADETQVPPALRAPCALAQHKCSRCHSIDRVLVAQVTRPRQWETYVSRMRRMSSSGISETDGDQIVRCLVYRSFGVDQWPKSREEEPRDRIWTTPSTPTSVTVPALP
jgi:hypothetical protein